MVSATVPVTGALVPRTGDGSGPEREVCTDAVAADNWVPPAGDAWSLLVQAAIGIAKTARKANL
jgi:hypothetical protein